MIAFTRVKLLALGLAGLLVACGPTIAPRDEVVPKELVPEGYQQSECHFAKMWLEPEPQDHGGVRSMGGTAGSAVANADSGGHEHVVHPPVQCEHTVKDAIQQCFDDNGVEHPMQWCLDRKAARDAGKTPPTSGTPQAFCGESSGTLMKCQDEG